MLCCVLEHIVGLGVTVEMEGTAAEEDSAAVAVECGIEVGSWMEVGGNVECGRSLVEYRKM